MSFFQAEQIKFSVGQIGLGTRISGEAPEAEAPKLRTFKEAPQLNIGDTGIPLNFPKWC